MTNNRIDIDWTDPNLDLDLLTWIKDIDKEENFSIWENKDWNAMCDWECSTCMTTPIDEVKTKLGAVLCCKSHPETWEVNEETSACPEYNMNTWECNIYDSDEYPAACKNYHCKTHNR